jgi:creatinine amidohydrolase/Fe(II)-dependent formamide hydrolase-like protein
MKRVENDPLDKLRVWDRLRIGPTKVEQRRLVTRYSLRHGRKTVETDLIYRYEEEVFDPADPTCQNLASMISAQVALNYGLFCKEMVFEGSFDARDQRFIREFASNTAREIYALKLLQPNPFLVGDVAHLPVVKKDNYLAAKINFTSSPETRVVQASRWATEDARQAVLSSGGKDSLLSYGILGEIGPPPHAIFVNESGRHWFTALNAYRHLAETDQNTARAWTNCDRVFAWMLRQMPFVRPDFAAVRSDEYPIRLWTVAVFLFGALPLLRKRGIGRLVIGDEFDTTARGRLHGIVHYNGLYDQSLFFDRAMSRYFHGKGWGVDQFSILRPLSEILIEKTLVERFPDLQAHQVSCHATHVENGRVKPCGRCEKCRRIVAMLAAFGHDPGRCGYTEDQVHACLVAFARRGVHQETAGAEHLTYLLAERGVLPGDVEPAHKPRPHPEVASLRYDPERSPLDTVPADLRAPLHQILLGHAEGALRREGRKWVELDGLSEEALGTPRTREAVGRAPQLPVKFDTEPSASGVDGPSPATGAASRWKLSDHLRARTAASAAPYLLGSMTWPEAESRLATVDIALLPVGAIEQHGAHLPLDTDAFDADVLAREVAAGCSEPTPIVLPLIPYGVSYHHDDFKGTVSVGPDTLAQLVRDVGMAVARNGVRKLVIINGHGGNIPALHFSAQMINRDAHIFVCVDSGESSDTDVESLAETPNDVHAGEIETSTSLYLRPQLVQIDKAKKSVPKFSIPYLNFSSKRSVGWYGRTEKISTSGVLGDPTQATREKGERMWRLMVDNLVRLVEDLKGMTLEEIHQRRY